MKKFIVVFTLLLTSSALFAQLSFGPKIGYTANSLTTDWNTISQEATGSKMHFGVFVRLGERFYLQPEAVFMTKSSTFKEDIQNLSGGDHTLDLKTVDVPILLGLKVLDLKLASFRIFGGPVASILVDSKESFSNASAQAIFNTENFKTATWNANLGVGVDVLMFTIDLRYDYGITSVFSDDDFDLKNQSFLVSLGWKLF